MAISIHTSALSATAAANETIVGLRRILSERRRALISEINNKIKDARVEASGTRRPTVDTGETTEVEAVDDLAFMLLQMKSHVLNRINLAVQRLDEGSYGYCIDCMNAILPSRLRALPFAVRCKDCEERCEQCNSLGTTRSSDTKVLAIRTSNRIGRR